jgi:riboflavin kinase/FMN adenylyltransferase
MERLESALGLAGDSMVGAGGCVATLGNFDGVHAGHRRLIAETVVSARGRGLPSVAVTFDPHPIKTLAPGDHPGLLSTLAQKLDIFGELGLDYVWTIPFGRDLSCLSPGEFLDHLNRALAPSDLHVGRHFRFGMGRAGEFATLAVWGGVTGCAVHGHSFAAADGGGLSSSRVRQILLEGDVGLAHGLLGAPYSLTGVVVEGERRGRRLGFPTANLAWEQELLPATGVYVTAARCRSGADAPTIGLTNIGTKPTFGRQGITVETHLPGMDADLYGTRLELGFLHRLRGEERFGSPELLRARIAQDLKNALDIWPSLGVPNRPT